MLKIIKKLHGIQMIECWYAEEPVPDKGIVRYMESSWMPEKSGVSEFRTLLSDLTETEEEIMSHFSKSCLYKVKRAPREGVTCNMYTPQELLEGSLIKEFAEFFEAFWKSKGVDYQEKEKCVEDITSYAKLGAASIGTASVNGKVQVYHVYVMDENKARLLHSASQFRVEEEIPQTVVGFANRYLHKEAMLFFKQLGKTTYDWGGAGLDEEVASITHFKESFGGQVQIYYNFEMVNGVWPKVIAGLSGLSEKFGGKH